MIDKILIALCLCFTIGAATAHALWQPVVNDILSAEEQLQEYRESAVIGYVKMDSVTKELYEVKK